MKQINKVVHRLRGSSALDKVDLARFAVKHLTGNIHFISLAAQVGQLEHATNVLASAITAANSGDHELVGLKQVAESRLMLELSRMCSSVNGVAVGDRAKLLTSGLPLRRENAPVGELPPPTGLVYRFTSGGSKRLAWKGHAGTKAYNVFISGSSEPFNWKAIGYTTKQSFTLNDLVPGTFYWFSVTAIGTAGEGSRSEPFRLMAAA